MPSIFIFVVTVALHLITNSHGDQQRFQDKSIFPTEKDNDLLLFMSITSGPKHFELRNASRNSWLLPCMAVKYCDYRFFIDAHDITTSLVDESLEYNDIVFRNACSLMDRHHRNIHYGNSYIGSDFDKDKNFSSSDHPYRFIHYCYDLLNVKFTFFSPDCSIKSIGKFVL